MQRDEEIKTASTAFLIACVAVNLAKAQIGVEEKQIAHHYATAIEGLLELIGRKVAENV